MECSVVVDVSSNLFNAELTNKIFLEHSNLLFHRIGSDQSLAERYRYPSVIVFTPTDFSNYVTGLSVFLQQFNWTTITLVCDSLSRSPLGSFTQSLCLNVQRLFDPPRGTFRTHKISFDSSANVSISYDSLLAAARKQSRGTRGKICQ